MDRAKNTTTRRLTVLLVVVLGSYLVYRLRYRRPDAALALVGLAASPVVLVWAVTRSLREAAPWALYMLAFVVFAELRAGADTVLGLDPAATYVVGWERALFGGLPTEWLQGAFYEGAEPGLFVWAMVGVHVSYFLVPHALAFFFWAYRRRHFVPFLSSVIATYYVCLFAQMHVPTAPPWWAGREGVIGTVHRVLYETLGRVDPDNYALALAIVGENDVAAMPSLHTAVTVLVALAAARLGWAWAVAGWGYALLMVFALTFLGEHYVVDAIVGGAVAWAIWGVTLRWDARRRADRASGDPGAPRPTAPTHASEVPAAHTAPR